jgi:hypothetical protein
MIPAATMASITIAAFAGDDVEAPLAAASGDAPVYNEIS